LAGRQAPPLFGVEPGAAALRACPAPDAGLAVLRQLPLAAPAAVLCAMVETAACRLNCCMARCWSAKGTRCTAAGVLRLKKCTFSELCGTLVTARLE
jgi:hypothetical protein